MRRWLAVLAVCWSLAFAAEGPNSAAALYEWDLPAAPLPKALRALYQQSGIVASTWLVAAPQAILTARVKGRYSLDEAMARMLAPTGLRYQFPNERSVVIMAQAPNAPDDPSGELDFDWPAQSVGDALIALGDQTNIQVASEVPPGVARKRVPALHGRLSVAAAADHIARAQADGQLRWMWSGNNTLRFYYEPPPREPASATQRAATSTRTEELFVTGSRIPLNTTDALPTFLPLQVFEARDIEALNIGADGDFLAYTPQQPYQRAEFSTFGENYSELRGFGWDTTLVLLNGSRTAASSVIRNSVDLDHIPAALVERLEVLADTGSAAYGGEAMGGVVNVVLRRQFSDPRLEIEYGGLDGGARSRRASLGFTIPTQHTMTTVFLESLDEDMLLGDARGLWRDQDYRRLGGTDYRSPAGNPGTVRSPTGANLPGLSSPIAAIPAGAGEGLTTDDLLDTQGQRNYTSLSQYYLVRPERTRRTGYLSSKLMFEDASLTADLLAVDVDRAIQNEPLALVGARVPANNPFNPFQSDVLVDYLLTGVGPERRSMDTQWVRGGLSLELRRAEWTTTLSLTASDESTDTNIRRANAARAMSALAQTDRSRALNPFRDGPGGDDDLLASLQDTFLDRQRSRAQQVAVLASGPIFSAIQTRLGAEWRHEAVFLDTPSGAANTHANRGRDVSSMFAELEIPVLHRPSGARASVVLAGRMDRYSDAGVAWNPNLGVVWSPVPGFVARAAFGESTRPASLFEMYTPQVTIANVPVRDPRRGGQLTPVTFVSGGNPDLEPATSQSLSASLMWQPPDQPWHVLATWWRTQVENRVAIASLFQLLSFETTFADRVLRAPPSSSDIDAGVPGALVRLDGTRLTGGEIQASGIDLQTQWRWNTSHGVVPMGLNATWMREYRYHILPGTTPTDAIGIARTGLGTIPRWHAIGTLGWELPTFKLTGAVSWIPAYRDTNPFGVRNGRDIGARVLIDAQAMFDLGAMGNFAGSDGLRLTIGAKNVLNQTPELAEAGAMYGFDASQWDILGREWYLKITKTF